MRLKEAAGWNQTESDWHRLLALEPGGCFGIDCDGRLAATTTGVCFGNDLAWIGMVLTHPDYRGRGLARALMEHALEYLDGRADWIKLDATEMGRPLYRKLGFEDECPVERWARAAAPPPPAELPAFANCNELDRAAFGADRRELLTLLARIESAALEDGYAMGRPGSNAAYFGPCVARKPATARRLLDWFLARHGHEKVSWDILPENREVVRLATECGFQPLRRLVRMARSGQRSFEHDDGLVYAIAGFEFG